MKLKQLHEAKYYKQLSAIEVLKQYKKLIPTFTTATKNPEVYMDTASIHSIHGNENNHVVGDLAVFKVNREQAAIKKNIFFILLL